VNQVIEQADEKYGLTVLPFTGSVRDYDPTSKAEYRNADRVAVTTYSGLFNTNPFFNDADILIVDGYWVPEDEPSSQNFFVYILEHPSRQDAEKNWTAFRDDPEWKRVKAESEKQGPLVDHIDSYFMDPTSYSALQ